MLKSEFQNRYTIILHQNSKKGIPPIIILSPLNKYISQPKTKQNLEKIKFP